MSTPLRRRAVVALATGAVALSVATAPTASAAATPSGHAAGSWLAGQLTDGVVHNVQWDYDDLGLSLDVLGALQALDVEPTTRQQILTAVTSRVGEYVEYTDEGVTTFYSGSAGKLLVAVDAAGGDVRSVAGRDLVAEIEGATNDATGESSHSYGLFGQTFATRGLIAGDSAEAGTSVSFVTEQQCSDGSFKQVLTAPCPAVPEVDTTAAALHTLLDAKAAGIAVDVAALDRAAAAIVAAQATDGSFVGNGVPNTNSTGLAAVALHRAGRTLEAAKAAAWVTRHQITEATASVPGSDHGAIAYDRAALAEGIDEFTTDQWIRATAQAAPALALVTSSPASVSVPRYARSGGTVQVSARGLAAGWSATARVPGGSSARALVPAAGRTTFTLRVPKGTVHRSVVIGDSTGRLVATTSVHVLAAAKLRVASKSKVRRTKVQKVVVRGLTKHEPVRVYFRGKLVKRGVATARGTYVHRFKVGRKIGRTKVVVRGAYANRNGVRAFRVVR